MKHWQIFPRAIWSSIRFYVGGLYKRFNDEDVMFLSAGIAFNGILCLIPLLLLITSVVGIFLQASHESIHQDIDEALNTIFPPQPYAQQIKSAIRDVVHDIVHYRSTFGLSGIAAFIWTATSLFSSVRIVLNRIYKLRTTKLVYVRIIENVILVIFLTVLFFIANVSTWLLQLIESWIEALPALQRFHISVSLQSVPFLVSYVPALVMFFIVNRYIPDKAIPARVALVSAFTTTSLWWIAGKGFAWYLTAFHSYSKLYGTYAFLLVFLIWIYYSAVVFIIGVIVGQLFRERHTQLPAA